MALARVPLKCRLWIVGRIRHVAPRSRSKDERPLGGALLCHSAYADHNQRATARARGRLAFFASSREIGSAVARTRFLTKAGFALQAVAHSSGQSAPPHLPERRPLIPLIFAPYGRALVILPCRPVLAVLLRQLQRTLTLLLNTK